MATLEFSFYYFISSIIRKKHFSIGQRKYPAVFIVQIRGQANVQPIGEISSTFQKWVKFDLLLQSNCKCIKKHRFCGLVFSSPYILDLEKMFV